MMGWLMYNELQKNVEGRESGLIEIQSLLSLAGS